MTLQPLSYLLLLDLVHIATKSFLSSTPSPTLFTRPNLASASAILSRNALCSFVIVASVPSVVAVSSSSKPFVVSTADDFDTTGLVEVEGFVTYSAIRVRTL